MNRKIFDNLVKNGEFSRLFIEEMGWNNPQSPTRLPLIRVDETDFRVEVVAARSDFKVLTCRAEAIPTMSVCRKVDFQIRKFVNEYLCIFVLRQTDHHLWMAPVRKVDKRDIVLSEYEHVGKADAIFQKMDGISFGADEQTLISDVRERINASFVINSEKITKDFYAGFKKEHNAFTSFITGVDDQIADKDNRNKQWYASVMLNRLMFCYFIQKKGFLDNNVNYLREKLDLTIRQHGENRFFKSFYIGFLRSLFHDGLNAPQHDAGFEAVYGRIPYLNGGMFDEHPIEHDYANLDIADEAFDRLFTFFDKWNWHLDTRLTASGKDINPDVLGYIFEQYINDRAQMGAYYTKEDITEYIGRNCILPFLFDAVEHGPGESAKDFKADGYVWSTLRESGDRYVFDAVKKGYSADWRTRLPQHIAVGLDTTKPDLLARRKDWNTKTDDRFALPTEIWRETVERLQRCEDILSRIQRGEITHINDFITYNLDIRSFAHDLLAKATDHHFVLHFYHALQKVTILDPTCGSGAFLFAAMNILEPLYEVCIDRMQEFHAQNANWFKDELDEIEHRYRSNIQYFIYKSIILRNLYGVDIMVEATEIAKLRLFLKMVAVVEVDRRAPNLGLDPLPDIDFNIRCGNTLVGYATEAELNKDLVYGDMFANQEFKEAIETEMGKVALAYEDFKSVQFDQAENMVSFKRAKHELSLRLKALNEKLNERLFKATADIPYEKWLSTHQPFHWLAEFYQIIQGNSGFDVIIGNPPYVEYNKKDKTTGKSLSEIYRVVDYKTFGCGNLYAFCMERSRMIINQQSYFGMIVPLSLTCGDRMNSLREYISSSYKNLYYSNFEIFPSKLFEGAFQRVSICMGNNAFNGNYVTKLYRWYSIERFNLFNKIQYANCDKDYTDKGIAKLASNRHGHIISSINSSCLSSSLMSRTVTNILIYYQEATNYWMKASMRIPYYKKNESIERPAHGRILYFENPSKKKAIFAMLNSSLFYCWYTAFSDGFHLTDNMVKKLPVREGIVNDNVLMSISDKLEEHIKNNSFITTRNTALDDIELESFRINLSKPIIDEIDKVLARHYGFTEEELDFIINYDIKYRMGDELNGEE
jgi:hypothetical protein